jgi:hypothetical protein
MEQIVCHERPRSGEKFVTSQPHILNGPKHQDERSIHYLRFLGAYFVESYGLSFDSDVRRDLPAARLLGGT